MYQERVRFNATGSCQITPDRAKPPEGPFTGLTAVSHPCYKSTLCPLWCYSCAGPQLYTARPGCIRHAVEASATDKSYSPAPTCIRCGKHVAARRSHRTPIVIVQRWRGLEAQAGNWQVRYGWCQHRKWWHGKLIPVALEWRTVQMWQAGIPRNLTYRGSQDQERRRNRCS